MSEPRRKRAFGLVAALALVAVAGLAVVLGLASRTDPSAPASNSNPDPNPNPNPNPNATDPGPGSDSAADPSNPETAGPREPSSAQAEPASITATIIELDLSPTDPKIDVAFEVEVDGQRLPGPPYRVELGDRARELVVRLDGHRSRTLVLDPHHPPASPLPVQLEALEPGLLSVVAPGVAWAEVWLDGVKIGTTPLADAPVPEGRHRLEVRCTADVCGEARLLLDQSVRIRAKRGTKVSAG